MMMWRESVIPASCPIAIGPDVPVYFTGEMVFPFVFDEMPR